MDGVICHSSIPVLEDVIGMWLAIIATCWKAIYIGSDVIVTRWYGSRIENNISYGDRRTRTTRIQTIKHNTYGTRTAMTAEPSTVHTHTPPRGHLHLEVIRTCLEVIEMVIERPPLILIHMGLKFIATCWGALCTCLYIVVATYCDAIGMGLYG